MSRSWTSAARALTSVPIAILLASCSSSSQSGSESTAATTSSALTAITTSQFVVYAERSVTLGTSDVLTGGNVGVHRAAPSAFGSQLRVGAGTQIDKTKTVFAPTVSLASGAAVGALDTTSLQNSGGTFTSEAAWSGAAMPVPPAMVPTTPATNNVTVAAFTSLTLNPGNYGALTVNGVLTLAPGTYSFASVAVGTLGAMLGGVGNVIVNVAGSFTTASGTTVAPSLFQSADKLTINVGGSDASSTSPAASLAPASIVTALLAVPHGTLAIGSNVLGLGAFSGYDVTVGNAASLTFQTGFSPTAAGQVGSQALTGYVTPAIAAAPVLGPLAPTTRLNLSLSLPVQNAAALSAFVAAVTNPASASYRKFITPATFASTYGATAASYQALTQWATSHGLTVKQTYPNRLLLGVSGTAAAIESALHVGINNAVRSDGTTFFAVDRNPSIDLATNVLHVTGLDNFVLPKRAGGSAVGGEYASVDLRAAYAGCTTMTGAGESVGVAEFHGYDPNNIAAFQAGLTPPSHVPVSLVLLDSATAGVGSSGTDFEAAADIELPIAMAPGLAGVTVFQAVTDYDAILTQMANTTPVIHQLSSSYSFLFDAATQQALAQMASQGQPFFQSSGDDGGYEGSLDNFAAASANITLVGGTQS